MTLQELLQQLAHGELSNLSLVKDGAITEESIPKVLDSINQGLTDLHTRFRLMEKELHVLCFASKTLYPLRKKNAVSDPTPYEPKYILDTPDYPYTGDLIQILSVTDERGYQVTVNDSGRYGSVFIPRFDTVQVTNPTNDKMLAITYQAKHPTIRLLDDLCCSAFLDQEIVVHPILEEALRLRIAYRTYSPMDRKEQAAKVALLDQKYEMLCMEAENRNLINGAAFSTTWKLESRGFV